MKPTWAMRSLQYTAEQWTQSLRKKKADALETSSWWSFIFDWPHHMQSVLDNFQKGNYQFAPMKQYAFEDECETCH